jgi:hypothetical protein
MTEKTITHKKPSVSASRAPPQGYVLMGNHFVKKATGDKKPSPSKAKTRKTTLSAWGGKRKRSRKTSKKFWFF